MLLSGAVGIIPLATFAAILPVSCQYLIIISSLSFHDEIYLFIGEKIR